MVAVYTHCVDKSRRHMQEPLWGKKVKLSLCLTNGTLRHEGVWGSGCIDPHFLDLGTSWIWVVSHHLRSQKTIQVGSRRQDELRSSESSDSARTTRSSSPEPQTQPEEIFRRRLSGRAILVAAVSYVATHHDTCGCYVVWIADSVL
jgi:hypothetical protein